MISTHLLRNHLVHYYNIATSNFKNKILLVTGPSQGVGKVYIFQSSKKFEELGKKFTYGFRLRRGSQASNFKTTNDKGITDRINLEPYSVSKNIDLISGSKGIKNFFYPQQILDHL